MEKSISIIGRILILITINMSKVKILYTSLSITILIGITIHLLFFSSSTSDKFFKYNNVEYGILISKSTIDAIEVNEKDEIFTENYFEIRIPDNWIIEQQREAEDPSTVSIEKNGYRLIIETFKNFNDVNGALLTSENIETTYVFDMDGTICFIPVVSNGQLYGPYNYVNVLFSPKYVNNTENEISTALEKQVEDSGLSIAIDLPDNTTTYDKEILTDIYSMIKSIKWQQNYCAELLFP